jgi:hypothetical protein
VVVVTRFGGLARGALVLLVVAAAACSDGGNDSGSSEGSSGDRDAYVDKIASTIDDPALNNDERHCFASAVVDAIGVDTLKAKVDLDKIDAGFTPADSGIEISDQQGADFYDRFSDCADVRTLILDSLSSGQELPEQTQQCLEDNIDDALVKQILVTSFTKGSAAANDPDLGEKLNAVTTACAPTASG